jgi:hypothetical protein
MEMPKPTPAHKQLERLAGTWRGKENMHPSQWSPDGCVADGETRSRVALGGFAVVCDYEQKIGDDVTFTGHGVYTIDAQNGDVVLHWFDSMGGGHEQFRGEWQGDKLMVVSRSPMMGHMRLTYDFAKPGELGSSMECSQDGKDWSTLLDAVYTRAD